MEVGKEEEEEEKISMREAYVDHRHDPMNGGVRFTPVTVPEVQILLIKVQ